MKKILFLLLCTVYSYGQTYQNPTFGTVTSKTNVEDNSAEKILVQNSLGKLNWIYKNSLTPNNYTKVVYVNNNNPNGATIFDLNNPPIVNDNLLKSDVNNLYIGNDASTWIYNSLLSVYVTKIVSITGTGTPNYLPKWATANTQTNSQIQDNGTNIGYGGAPSGIAKHHLLSTSPDLYVPSGVSGNLQGQVLVNNMAGVNGGFSFARFSASNVNGHSASAYLGVVNTSAIYESIFIIGRRTSSSNWLESMRIHGGGGVSIGNTTDPGTGGLNVNGEITATSETASTIASFDASKKIKSLPLTTYPSLTELSYVKGVTSALQTQLNVKASLASPAFTGNPTAPTAPAGTNNLIIANTNFVTSAIATAKPYKVYTALLSQTSTNNIVANVQENTLGGTVTWSRTSIGQYTATLSGAFTSGKTTAQISISYNVAGIRSAGTNRLDSNTVNLISASNTGTAADLATTEAFFEIRVYN